MLRNLFRIFIYFPLSLIVNGLNIPCSGTRSLYQTIRHMSLKNSYAFFLLMLTLSLCYFFSELITSTVSNPFLSVLISCYIFINLCVSIQMSITAKDLSLGKMYQESNYYLSSDKFVSSVTQKKITKNDEDLNEEIDKLPENNVGV